MDVHLPDINTDRRKHDWMEFLQRLVVPCLLAMASAYMTLQIFKAETVKDVEFIRFTQAEDKKQSLEVIKILRDMQLVVARLDERDLNKTRTNNEQTAEIQRIWVRLNELEAKVTK